jgi:hypothetical protein
MRLRSESHSRDCHDAMARKKRKGNFGFFDDEIGVTCLSAFGGCEKLKDMSRCQLHDFLG